MRDHTRRGVAYIVGRLAGNPSGSVYDYRLRFSTSMAGSVDREGVHVYDYDRHAHLGGGRSGDGFSLYDDRDRVCILLSVSGPSRFRGYDFGTGSYFEAQVNGRNVEVYDHETRQFHNYGL